MEVKDSAGFATIFVRSFNFTPQRALECFDIYNRSEIGYCFNPFMPTAGVGIISPSTPTIPK